MKTITPCLLLLCCLSVLMGCQYFQFPGVHKINVQQGHILTDDMLTQLKPGLNKRQVRFILGTPLIEDIFNDDRWDYYYSLKMGDGRFYKRTLTVYFDGNIMTHYDGDNLPELTSDDDTESDETDSQTREPETPVPD